MINTSMKLAAFRAVFLCLFIGFLSGCSSMFVNPIDDSFNADIGEYPVNIIILEDDLVKQDGRIAYSYTNPTTIV